MRLQAVDELPKRLVSRERKSRVCRNTEYTFLPRNLWQSASR